MTMRTTVLTAVAAASLLGAAGAMADDEPLSLKGAVPGMALSEFRALSYPAADEQGAAGSYRDFRVHCHGDPVSDGMRFLDLMPSRVRGALTCFHVANFISASPTASISVVPVGLAGLSVSEKYGPIHQVAYRFFPEGGPDSRLLQVDVRFDERQFAHMLRSLTAHYGEPTAVREGLVQNRVGATFDNHVVVWERGETRMTLTRFVGDLDTSTLVYLHPGLLSRWEDALLRDDRDAADF